ncbi:MAG: LPS export ABC transporter permease LptG [Rhizobiaceae bacterium]
MIGRTLFGYIATRYFKTVLGMMVSLLLLIIMVDFVEQLRKASEASDIQVGALLMLSLFKAPIFIDKAFPFGCLFAAMITLTQLNLKMELVVARAAGVSAWQFLMPVSAVSVLIGLFAAFIYNPLAIASFEKSKAYEVAIFDRVARQKNAEISGYWIKQEDESGYSVLNARIARSGGAILDDVKVLRFDANQAIAERIDARSAIFDEQKWLFEDATVLRSGAAAEKHARYSVPSNLSREILAGVTSSSDTVPFWNLMDTARMAVLAGGNPYPYVVQFYSLLSLPLFLVAMVLIAATVTLRFVRFGQLGRLILGGILSGFVLYTVTKLVVSLGSNGIVPPIVAAWSPSVVAILFGTSILLHQEDG